MTWQAYFETVQAGQWSTFYLLYGAEAYVKSAALETLRQSLLPEGMEAMNESRFEGWLPTAQIIEAAETLPWMCERRLVVIKDWPYLMAGKPRDGEAEAERFAQWSAHAPETCTVVFFLRDQPDKTKKAFKTLQALNALVEFPLLDDANIEKWVVRSLKPHQKKMTKAAIQALVFRAGRELTRILSELDKLIAYVGDATVIDEADVNAVVTPSLEASVFVMIDALMAGEREKALTLLQTRLTAGEGRIGILAMLTRQARLLTHMAFQREAGTAQRATEQLLSLNSYVARRLWAQCANHSAAAFASVYRSLVDMEYAVKSGRMRDQAALDLALFQLGTLSRCTDSRL